MLVSSPPQAIAASMSRDSCPVAKSPELAFVFGSPRSGTTWLGKVLDSNPQVAYLHEPISKGRGLFVHQVIHALRKGMPIEVGTAPRTVHDLLCNYARFLQPPFFRKEFVSMPYAAPLAWGWKRFTGRPGSLFVNPRKPNRVGAVVAKDGLCWFSRPLTKALGAKALILLRHPCGVVSSMLRGQKLGAMGKASREGLWQSETNLLTSLGYRAEDLNELAQDEFEALRWLAAYHEISSWADDEQIKILTYQQTVTHISQIVEEIFPWLGLPVADQTWEFVKGVKNPGREWLRSLFGARKMYYSVSPRSNRPDLAWQQELPEDSVRRILRVVESFPLQRYWPDDNSTS